jgi:hypothetical protein
MVLKHGEGHLIITLRTIVESSGNGRALAAAGISGRHLILSLRIRGGLTRDWIETSRSI